MKKQLKKIIALTALFVAMTCSSVFAAEPVVTVILHGYDYLYTVEYADTSKEVAPPVILLFVNGDIISDADAVIKNDTTLVPLRVISTRLGAVVNWNSATKTVDITKENTRIQMSIGNKNILVNGVQKQISHAPEIINSSTYVPLRAIASAFGAEVGYSDELLSYSNDLKMVYVQDRKEPIQISASQAIEIATNTYFNDFLPGMRDYIMETHNIDVYNINPDNIQYSSFGKEYFGRYYADFGQYYYIELFNGGVEFALVDKYDGTCYPVSSYSMIQFEINSPNCFEGWGWYYQ